MLGDEHEITAAVDVPLGPAIAAVTTAAKASTAIAAPSNPLLILPSWLTLFLV
jgi:hypothetical protein